MKMKLVDMTKEQLVNIILRKDDVEIRLKQEIVSLKQEKERLDNEYNRLKRRRIITICLILAITCLVSVVFFFACTASPKTAEKTTEVRLRDWSADSAWHTPGLSTVTKRLITPFLQALQTLPSSPEISYFCAG